MELTLFLKVVGLVLTLMVPLLGVIWKLVAHRISKIEESVKENHQVMEKVRLDFAEFASAVRSENADFRLQISNQYVSYEALSRMIDPVVKHLERLDAKMDAFISKAADR